MQAASFAAASSSKSALDGRGEVYGRGDDGDLPRAYAPPVSRLGSARIKINVRGMVFETYEETLAQYPQTLLGDPTKRLQYLNHLSGEYCFDRNKFLFDSILFFYQSHGILAFPEDIPKESFIEEIRFFQLQGVDERIKKEVDRPEKESLKPILLPENALLQKIWLLFEYPNSSMFAELLAKVSVIVIIISTVTFCLETVASLNILVNTCANRSLVASNDPLNSPNSKKTYRDGCYVNSQRELWNNIEAAYVAWFTFEYIMRLVSAPQRCKFVKSAMGMIDLLAIMPYYITLISRGAISAFPVLGIIRLLRIIRLLKLSRYSKGLKLLAKTLILSGSDLPSMFIVMIINIVLFSSVIFHVEIDVTDSDFKSIPDAFWWAVITMTTVGYGDQVPKGPIGKLVGTFCAVSGIVILFCFPTPVLLSHFEEMYSLDDKKKDNDKKQPTKHVSNEETSKVGDEKEDMVTPANGDKVSAKCHI